MARRQRKAMTRDNVILIKSFFMADNSATTKDAVKIFGYAPRTITGVCRAEYDRCLEERDLLKWGGGCSTHPPAKSGTRRAQLQPARTHVSR